MMGSNKDGKLGLGEEVIDVNFPVPSLVELFAGLTVRSISCGHRHTLAVIKGGTVFAWGCGSSGALGNGTRDGFSVPNKVEISEPVDEVSAG